MTTHPDGGCTLSGALSVTTEIEGCITIIHGPRGCAHHNFSLFHALSVARRDPRLPVVVSSDLGERDVIFGGEEVLDAIIKKACERKPPLVCVLSTCVTGAIGDDVEAVCRGYSSPPVISIPTAGFLGGGFLDGHIQALKALTSLAKPAKKCRGVAIVGEKTLEYEREEHYKEVARLLSTIGIPVVTRFVSRSTAGAIARIGSPSLNILRDPSMVPVGKFLEKKFGTPYIESFPLGLGGTLRFLEEVGEYFSIDTSGAVAEEEARQKRILCEFASLRGQSISLRGPSGEPVDSPPCRDLAPAIGVSIREDGRPFPLPDPFPVGTAGVRRLLHRWRRCCHA
ncbi:MAG: nitrogenase component 1 [Methanolinea sp.]|nr:nitrogenase component 1 [Methanolinea sp.]